jgi:four helix bundle protein
VHNLKELKIWNEANEMVVEVYELAKRLPQDETFGLSSQIKRSAVSVPSNIAEGAGRNSNKEFIYFLSIANGSSYELQTQLVLAKNLKLIQQELVETLFDRIDKIQKMNYRFQQALRTQ